MIGWVEIPTFAPGEVFGALCVVFVLALPWTWIDAVRPGRRPSLRFSVTGYVEGLPRSWRQRTWFVPATARTAAVLCLVFALLRPQSTGMSRDTGEGIAIEMVLDVSGSMSEADFVIDGRPARRMDAVKQVFQDFVLGTGGLSGRRGDLIGMTTFAMYPDVRCPLTPDHANLVNLLRETDIPGWVRGRQVYEHPEANYTALGDAIVRATDELRKAGEKAVAGVPGAEAARSRVMILLTDGYDNPAPALKGDAVPPVEAAKLAAKFGIRIYTIGAVGSQPVPAGRARGLSSLFQRRAEVDEATLQEVARATGGKYFRAEDVESLTTIYDEIDKLERRKTGERVYNDDTSLARRAMLIGLMLLAGELVLSATWYRKGP
ncbi:MAG: aerotolerance regulator BatA [Planctomycetota bacterium]|nr:MAG: aerotolerance regulator BatA [Planctomycetota bacterium]